MSHKGVSKKKIMWQKIISFAIALIFILSMVGVLFINRAGAATLYPITIEDGMGTSITLNSEPQRIVSLNAADTEMLFAVGAGDKVVGVTNFCNYPEEAKDIAKIGDSIVNVEAVLALRPDVVVAEWDLQPDVINRLKQLGLTVVTVNARSASDIVDSMMMLGRVCGTVEQAKEAVGLIEDRLTAVKEKVGKVGAGERPSVFIEIWNDPIMTAGGGTFMDELIQIAGGKNIAASQDGWPILSSETVISENPDVILLTYYNRDEVLNRTAWKGISAVKEGKVYEMDPDIISRNGPRFIDAIEEMVEIFYAQ